MNTSLPISIGYSINIKNEPYIPVNWDSIITPTRLLVTVKYKNQIIEIYYLPLGINASRENINQRLNQRLNQRYIQ